jgi:hypothetical protein
LKKEVNDFVNAKLDSARRQLHPSLASHKKPLFVQASYKNKTSVKGKKSSNASHKKTASVKKKKKHKTPSRHYSTSLKKEKSVADNRH